MFCIELRIELPIVLPISIVFGSRAEVDRIYLAVNLVLFLFRVLGRTGSWAGPAWFEMLLGLGGKQGGGVGGGERGGILYQSS